MREEKEWQDPELIVLVRSKPEEAILATCKAATLEVNSTGEFSGCRFYMTGCLVDCDNNLPS